jgi:hypothetical protein
VHAILHRCTKRKEADEANLAKSEFMAICAHEIRTPLQRTNHPNTEFRATKITQTRLSYPIKAHVCPILGETITRPNNSNGKKQPQQMMMATAQQQVLLKEQQQQQQQAQQAQAQDEKIDFFQSHARRRAITIYCH